MSESLKTILSPEVLANSQENASELLFQRLNCPIIKNQIIDLLYRAELWDAENTVYDIPSKNPDGTWVRDENGKMVFAKEKHKAKTREEIERDYEQTLQRIMSFTEIDFGTDGPTGGSATSNEILHLGWKLPQTNKKPTTNQWSIFEAHEKGHSMRPFSKYNSKFFKDYFSSAFDLSRVNYTLEDYQQFLDVINSQNVTFDKDSKPLAYEDQRQEFFNYLFDGNEIAERMSQLKNYFGFKGDEQFTLDHLNYAREHYINDTGVDNSMMHFFSAITDETAPEFIRLINSSGI